MNKIKIALCIGISTIMLSSNNAFAVSITSHMDTIRFCYRPTTGAPVKVKIYDMVTIVDGEVMPDKYYYPEHLKPGEISKIVTIVDSLTCVTYGGKKATENGLIYIITNKNAGKIILPQVTKESRPASYSPWAKKKEFIDPWTVEGGENLDSLPMFQNGKNRAFQDWLMSTALSSGEKYMQGPYSPENYGPTTVSFVVTNKGMVRDVKVLQKRTELFNAAVTAIVSDSPVWIPAKKNGRPVSAVVTYPVDCFLLIK